MDMSSNHPIMQLGTLVENQRKQNGSNMLMGFQDVVIRDLRQDAVSIHGYLGHRCT